MADWYVSSAAYAAISAFVPSVAYTVGQIVKPSAPTNKAKWAFRCTTAGAASTEPTWPTANNATITTGGATFTNVTGQSAYFWAAAAGDLATLYATSTNNRLSPGDRVFLSSDHAETQTSATNYGSGSNISTLGYGVIQFISVNRAGSTPPVAADILAGASITVSSGLLSFYCDVGCYHNGITYTEAGTSSIQLTATSQTSGHQYFKNCTLSLSGAGSGQILFTSALIAKVVLDNTVVNFSHAAQKIGSGGYALDFLWFGTASAVTGTALTTNLFNSGGSQINLVTCRGVDLSAVASSLVGHSGNYGAKYLFDSCKIASGVTRYNTSSVVGSVDEVELVNCYDGTHFLSERYQPVGTVTTEFTITLAGGATDDVGTFSHKMVSNANVDKFTDTLTSFWFDVENTVVGSSKTATVEIVSSGTLNNDDISLLLEYQGTAGSSVASFVNSLPATPLTANAAVTTSTATWNSLPATPVKQKLQVTFTPQVKGRVRGQVRLGKASTTVYVNPQVTII